MNLTLFDLDNTLLSFDSDYEWGSFLARLGVHDATYFAQRNSEFYEDYKAGTLDIYAYVSFLMSALKNHRREEINQWHAQYMREIICPQIRKEATALVKKHQEAGDLCAVVTATNSFVTRPIADCFGLEHLIATEPEQTEHGEFTGKIIGIPSFREGKITRVEQWLEQQGLQWDSFGRSVFYSDSFNDLPLLQKVTHPVATNPDERLFAYAQQHHWPILQLFG